MEREKNERLTARKIEEEEMKRKLTDIGIYEPEFTYKQMKELLGFINGSQDTSDVVSNNKDTHKGHVNNQHLSEIASDVNASPEMTLQECTEVPSCSYRLNHTSPTVHEHKTGHYVNNPGSPSLFEVQNPMYRRKSSDSDEMFEKQYENTSSTHSTNRFLSLRSTNVLRECQKTAQDTQDEFVQKLERWRMNPLDVCINENDVPLRQPNRPSAEERVPFRYCKETHTSEQRDQAIRFVSQHLKEVADLWYSWHPAANSIFQWGSPIQVGTNNGSLDKKPLTESKTEQIKAECTYKDSHERASKRKANSLISNLTRESSSEDEDKWYSFVRDKKKRVQSDSKSSNEQHAHDDCHEKATSSASARQGNSTNDNNSDTDLDNDFKVFKSKKSKKTEEKIENVSPTELNIYPRRIVPPNPKARLSLPRLRKETTSKSSPKTRRNGNKINEQAKKQKSMTDKEISRKLMEDWNSDEEEVEMRPLPIPKEIRSRLHQKQMSLHGMKTKAKEEESDEERSKEKKPKLCEQRKKKEELHSSRVKNGNGSWEHQLMSDDDEDKIFETKRKLDVQNGNQSHNVTTSTSNVNCPICNKLFPHSEIENHASNCEQFEINNEEGDDNSAATLECNVCNDYKTSNGVKYEDHVQQCLSRHYKRHPRGSQDIDTASASSFHINKRIIDEQKDSEIAYLGQFSSNKTKTNTNRKRKLYTKKNEKMF